jgi:CDP-paratose 2-epimerase
MKWLITGGAGFIGCHAADHFLSQGHRVVVVDNLSRRGSTDNLAWLKSRGLVDFARIDIRNADAVRNLLTEHADADAVLHLAGQVAVTSSVADPRTDFEINALGTFNVLEAVRVAAAGQPAVLYSSTNKVYGNLEHVRVIERNGRYEYEDRPLGVSEAEPIDLHSPYGCSKGTGDQYVRDYARIYGLRTVTFRQSCIFGTRQFGIEDQGWIAWFCAAAILGRPVTIYGDGKQIRDTLWVGDLITAYERAFKRIENVRGETFNLGGGPTNTLSLLELVARLEAVLGSLNVHSAHWRPGDQRVFVADVRKAEQLLDWRPTVSTVEGVDRLIVWIQENRSDVAHALGLDSASDPKSTVSICSRPGRVWRVHAAHPALRRPCPRPRPKRLAKIPRHSWARVEYQAGESTVTVRLPRARGLAGSIDQRIIVNALECALSQARDEGGAEHAA